MPYARSCASLLIAGCVFAGPTAAISFNPIGQGVPMSIHARASCANGLIFPNGDGDTTITNIDRMVGGNCSGSVVMENPATLSTLAAPSTASANIAQGTMRATAVGRSYASGADSLRVGTQSEAKLFDTLTVNGSWTGTKVVELRLTVDGSFTSNATQPNWMSTSVITALAIWDANDGLLADALVRVVQGNDGTPFIISQGSNDIAVTTNAVNTVFNDPTDVRITYSYLFGATEANRSFSFLSRLYLEAGMGFGTNATGPLAEGLVDFGNTAQLSLIVPDGVTVSSESGVFLTAVPEPESYALMLAGLLAVGGAATLRRRQSVQPS